LVENAALPNIWITSQRYREISFFLESLQDWMGRQWVSRFANAFSS
jgi:hypothetical protein